MREIGERSRPRRVILAAAMAAAVAGHSASATTFVWLGVSDALWSTAANWSPAVRPTSSPDNVMVFGPVGVSGTTLYNDLLGMSFQLNNITFNSNAPSLVNKDIYGTPLDFRNSSASVAPTLIQNSPSSQTIEDSLVLTNTVTFQGTGSGKVDLSGTITGAGGLNDNSSTSTLNLSGGTGANPGSILFLAVNNGTTTMSGGVLNLTSPDSTGFSSGNSSVFVEGGATLTIQSSAVLNSVGLPQVHNAGVINLDHSTWNNTNSSTAGNEIRIGYAGGTSKLNIIGGTLTTGGLRLGHSDFAGNPGHGLISIQGGTITVGSLTLNDTTGSITIDGGGQMTVGTVSLAQAGTTIAVGNSSTFTIGAGDAKSSFAAVLNNLASQTTPGSFTKIGTNSALITSANSGYSGRFDLQGGALGAGNDSALGSGTIVGGGGSLYAASASRSFSNPVTLSSGSFLGVVTTAGDVHPITLTGVISGAGSLLVNAPGATVTLGSTQSSTFGGGELVAGSLVQSAGTVSLTGGFTSDTNTNLTVSKQWNFSGGTFGGGTLGGTTTINAGGTLTCSAGSIQVNGAILNNGKQTGEIDINAQGFATGAGSFGTLNVNGGGTVSPGTTIGTFSTAFATVTNGMTLASGSTYVEDINTGGLSDNLFVSAGSVTLGGTLQLSLHNGVVPALANYTPFLSSGNSNFITGTFAQITGQEINPTTWLAILYHPHNVGYSHTFPGDASLDGFVNTTDFTILAAHFNQSGQSWPTGDFNGDGVVNALDFNALASFFGANADNSAPLGTIVPEPCGVVALLGMAIMQRRRRRGQITQP